MSFWNQAREISEIRDLLSLNSVIITQIGRCTGWRRRLSQGLPSIYYWLRQACEAGDTCSEMVGLAHLINIGGQIEPPAPSIRVQHA